MSTKIQMAFLNGNGQLIHAMEASPKPELFKDNATPSDQELLQDAVDAVQRMIDQKYPLTQVDDVRIVLKYKDYYHRFAINHNRKLIGEGDLH